MLTSALLVVDVQVAPFIWAQYGGKELYQAESLIGRLKFLIQKAHAARVPVIYLQYTEGPTSFRALGQPLWQIHPEIAPEPQDTVIAKYHGDSFMDTTLQQTLQKLGVDHLVITGVQTEYCVDTTCRAAFSRGYQVTLVQDGHSTFDTDLLSAEQIIAHHNTLLSSEMVTLQNAADVNFVDR